MGKGRDREEIKTKPGRLCPGLPWLPRSLGLALGSWASLCRAPGGVGVGGWAGGVRVGAREKWVQTEAPEGDYTYHSFLEMKDPSF